MSRAWKVLLSALVFFGLGMPIHASADQALESGIDRPGNDLKRIELEPTIAGTSICRGLCVKDRSCTTWTFVRSGVQGPKAVCYLKFDIPAAVPNNCCASGVVQRRAEPNIDRPGMDMTQLPFSGAFSDAPSCQHSCDRDPGCFSWTYVVKNVQGPTAFCYLKNGVPDAVQNDCCTSGVKSPQ